MIEVCPDCSSAKIETKGSLLAKDVKVICLSCGWEGVSPELLLPVQSSTGLTADQALSIAQEVSTGYLTALAKRASQPIGLAMVESGIVGLHDKARLTRLIRAATLGAQVATLKEVEAIQKELQKGVDNAGN